MAEQRLYLPSSGTATITVAFATWAVTTNAVSWYGSTASHGGTALTTVSATEVSSAGNQLLRQFIFRNVFTATHNITGTVKGQIRCRDIAGTALPGSQMNIRVVNNGGTVTRGTVYAFENATATVTWGATDRNAKFPKGWTATAGDAVATVGIVATSDLLVVEVGPRVGVGGEGNNSMRFGNPGSTATDLTEDETSTIDNRPWIAMLASIFATTTGTATTAAEVTGPYTKMLMGVGLGMGSLIVLPHVPAPWGNRRAA